jgi:hypothetical protein
MTTQYERDMIAREVKTRRLHALVEAATASLPAIGDPLLANDLRDALAPYSLPGLRGEVEWADRAAASRQAEADRVERGLRALEELPDAPPRRQCEAYVARDMGRWTDFGRCEKTATRIIMDVAAVPRRERCVCSIHAKEFARDGRAGTGFGRIGTGKEEPTSADWYRVKGWCMVPDPNPDPRKPERFCVVRVDMGNGHHHGKEHKWA